MTMIKCRKVANKINEVKLLMKTYTEYTQELFKRSGASSSKSIAFEVRDNSTQQDGSEEFS